MSEAEMLKEKIISEAGEQAGRVLQEAQKRSAAITARGEADAKARREALLADAQTQAAELKRRARTIAELDARKQILTAKEKLIEDTFAQALARLQELGREAYQDLLFPMILAAVQYGDEDIIVSPDQRHFFDATFLGKLNKTLKQQGKKGELTLAAEIRPLKGGFVLRAGDVEINNTFNSLLRMQRDSLEPAVARMLFE